MKDRKMKLIIITSPDFIPDEARIVTELFKACTILQLQLIVRNLLESHKLMLTVERSAIMLFAILMKCASDIP